MSDIRLSMREFRLLEEKRKLGALSDAEERRWTELGQSLGILEGGGPRGPENGARVSVQLDGPSSQAPADESDGFAEVDPDDVMEVDPGDVLLVEPEGEGIAPQAAADAPTIDLADPALATEQIPGFVSSETALSQSFEWVSEAAPLGRSSPLEALAPLDAAAGPAPSQSESPAPEPDPGAGIELTQNFEWVPESAPVEGSIPFEAGTPGDAAPEPIELLPSESSAETSAAEVDPEPSGIPLTQNFEWVPVSPAFESSVPLETEAAQEGVQPLEEQITAAEAAQLPPEPAMARAKVIQLPAGPTVAPARVIQLPAERAVAPAKAFQPPAEPAIAPAKAIQLPAELTIAPARAIQLPAEPAKAPARAIQLPAEPMIASAQVIQLPPEPPIAAMEAQQQPPEQEVALDSPVIDLLESDAMQGEIQSNSWESDQAQPEQAVLTQAVNEPAPSILPQQSPAPAEPPPARPPEPVVPYAADSTSATGYGQISSTQPASPTFQFQLAEPLRPAEPPEPPQPEAIAVAPAEGEHPTQVPAAAIWLSAAAQALPAQDPETSFDNVAPAGDTNEEVNGAFVAGEHRVVVHLIDGQVKRGTVQDLDLTAGIVPLQSAPGVVDNIAADRLKAIFFMRAAGAGKSVPSGQKIHLTLQDGREVVGFSHDFKTGNPGFFLCPVDQRTNTDRIFVPRWSVYSIEEL